MRKLEFERSMGFFKSSKVKSYCRFVRSFGCRVLDEWCVHPLLKALKRVFDVKPHPLMTLVILTLFCSFMGWPYAWVLLQIPNPFRTIAIFGTIITFVVGAVAVNPERRC